MNIQNVLSLLEHRHGLATSVPLVTGIINNALFQSSQHINQSLPQIIHVLDFAHF